MTTTALHPGIAAGLILLTVACATGAPRADGPEAPEQLAPAPDEMAPPPFTAEQIRGATAEGRTYRFRLEAAGEPAMLSEMRFVDVTAEGATMIHAAFTEEGAALGEPKAAPVTWEDLVAHARWPQAATEITEEEIDTPAGRFHCRLYTVREEEEGVTAVTRAWFAMTLPGAPVRHEVTVGGQVVSRMVLQSHAPGGEPADR